MKGTEENKQRDVDEYFEYLARIRPSHKGEDSNFCDYSRKVILER